MSNPDQPESEQAAITVQNVFLVGPMGAGKSTIGRQLARQLRLDFHDSDQVIEQRTGVDIPRIFDIEGEAGFRRREQQIIDDLTQLSGVVLATGGGVVLNPENRAHLHERGFVIYLRANAEQLLKRTDRDTQRPLLQEGDDRLSRIRQLLAERDALYTEVAHLIIDTEHLTVRRTVNDICKRLQITTTVSGDEKPAS